ncbi:transposase, partial [Streptomyces collinus]|uniref:transposase n=1 Tax=Streptomyces collinus TaxID=42684 RepID=UPI00369E6FBD
MVARIWAGTDIGKTHHHCVVLNAEGERLLSRRILNDEPELLALLADVLALDEDVVWAVDVAELDLGNAGPLILLTGYQTPAALRRAGGKRLETWLRNRKVRSPEALAQAALEAAERQHTAVPGEKITAQVIHTLAKEVMSLNEQITGIDKLIAARFRDHELAEVISSMPGIGPLLGAEFLAATAGDMSRYGTADRLASLAGVAPVPRDSGNLHRPRRYHRGLQRVFYTSALISIRSCDRSRRFYERKRADGKRHTQAVLALARRRVNVLWALLRDGQCYQSNLPVPE